MSKFKERDKFKILRVTTTADYLIPMIDDKRTKINGWPLDALIEDWFVYHSLSAYHATRDAYLIGNSKKFIKADIQEKA